MKDMRDDEYLKKIEKLFEKGLSEAAKDPERIEQIRNNQDRLVKPWEKAVGIWEKNVKDKSKKASEVVRRFLTGE